MNRQNLDKALALFIDALRTYLPAELKKKYGKLWDHEYYETLSDNQKKSWEMQQNSDPRMMIDFHSLRGFSIKQKKWLREIVGRDANRLPTKFEEIATARHMVAHYDEWDDHKATMAYHNMIAVTKIFNLTELEQAIQYLEQDKPVEEQIAETSPKVKRKSGESGVLEPVAWFNNVRPHLDIRQGNLDESVFAADLAEVATDSGRAVYSNASLFFEKTFFTQGLTNIANRVVAGLNGHADGQNRVISLQTGFGGGKTHTLISLFHLAQAGAHIADNEQVAARLKELPNFERARVAVFTNTTNDPTQGRKTADRVHLRTLWGELAYQLNGKEGYERIRPNDEARTAPKGLFRDVLAGDAPALILIDELADYCVAAAGVTVGGSTLSDQTISFIQELTEGTARTPNCVAVITLPASVREVANSPEAEKILSSLADRVARVGADTKPVRDEEIYEVIRYRLFEGIGDEDLVDAAIHEYKKLYRRQKSELPTRASRKQYNETMRRAYPFHPELIDIFRLQWASHSQFQRTRGVLRLLATIVSDLWKRRSSLTGSHLLIHSAHLELGNLDTLTGEVKKLYGNGYDAAISADVAGSSSNAARIDEDKPEFREHHLTQGIATTVFLNSFGSAQANRGISVKELKLQLLPPSGLNHNSINTGLDELQNRAYYLHYSQLGGAEQRFWFHTKPNLNILVNSAHASISDDKIETYLLELLREQTRGVNVFTILINPAADEVPEQHRPTLVILKPSLYNSGTGRMQKYIGQLAQRRGNTERTYRNTLLFLSLSEPAKSTLYRVTREYLACLEIRDQYRTNLDEDQRADLKNRTRDTEQQVYHELVTAYHQIHKFQGKQGLTTLEIKDFAKTLETQINQRIYSKLKDESWLLETVGYKTLENNNLVPVEGKPVLVYDIWQAFIRFDDKPMIRDEHAVSQGIKKYVERRMFALASRPDAEKDWTHMEMGTVGTVHVQDETIYLVAPNVYDQWKQAQQPIEKPLSVPTDVSSPSVIGDIDSTEDEVPQSTSTKVIKQIRVNGSADAVSWSHLFRSFILPLKDNDVRIEFTIRAKTKDRYPLTEESQQIKIVRESARQLGFNVEVDEE